MNQRDVDFYLDLETRVWDALVAGDPEADGAMLSDDFLGVYSTGFSNRAEHMAQLADGPTMSAFALSDARLTVVAAQTVMLSYRADYRPATGTGEHTMYISSLWQQRDGRWWNTFSQDTPLSQHAPAELPLAGRTAVVTGVSRRQGIGFAIASRLVRAGASLFVHHYSPHDAEQPWGADDIDDVLAALRADLAPGAELADASLDLAAPDAGQALIEKAGEALGHLDVLVCNHARSGGDGLLQEQDAAMLDGHWAVNARSTLLATRAFAAQHDGRRSGRVVWMTSGQLQGPMIGEIAYATSKAALAGITPTVAADLVRRGIRLNTVNPGPVNTGYLDEETTDRPEALAGIRAAFPLGRMGEPDDPARLIEWLVSDAGEWIVGQVISSEGGFDRFGIAPS